ncbi:hypothetical protein KI387_014165, partial [Taxus chinensis]
REFPQNVVCSWCGKQHKFEECPQLYEHMSKNYKKNDKGAGMIKVQRVVEDQWMPKIVPDPEMLPVLVTTHAKVARAHEIP